MAGWKQRVRITISDVYDVFQFDPAGSNPGTSPTPLCPVREMCYCVIPGGFSAGLTRPRLSLFGRGDVIDTPAGFSRPKFYWQSM